MLERAFEILVRHCPEDIFGPGWKLTAQQLTLRSGRFDLLFSDAHGQRHVVELKKGRATLDAVHQVLQYAKDISELLDGAAIVPWVVAHEIPAPIHAQADSLGVRTLAVSIPDCARLMAAANLGERDLLGARRAAGILHGGAARAGVHRDVGNEIAYAALPRAMAEVLRGLEQRAHFLVRSGAMQTVVHYRGVKLGGVNRAHRGGVGYIAEGVVLREEFASLLRSFGFQRMTKTQTGGHEHIWWEIPVREAASFERAIDAARDVVDRALEIV